MPISAAEPLLNVAGLSTGYGKISVLRGIDLTVGANEVVALLGPNGAGKTTLLRAVSGLLPWSGRVHFGGRDLAGASPRDTVKAGLSHVIEGHRVFTQLSVLDNLLLAVYDLPRRQRAARVEEALSLFPEIAAKRHERAAALSGGQQRRVLLARLLASGPRVLVLDEPFAGLDDEARTTLTSVLAELRAWRDVAIIVVSHDLDDVAPFADRILGLRDGSLALDAGADALDDVAALIAEEPV